MLSSKLSDAADIEAVIKIAVESMSRLLQVNVGCIYVGEQAEPIYIQQLEKEQLHRSVTDVDEIRRKYEQNIWRMRKTGHFRSTDRIDFWQLS